MPRTPLSFLFGLVLATFTVAELAAQNINTGRFIDIDATNTAAVGGTPSPFFTDDVNAAGFTSGALWRRRAGFGFNIAGNREIYEKDANGGIGNAATLVTTVTGLVPGQVYGVHVAFISVPTESWRVRAGSSTANLTLFTPTQPLGRVTDIGLSAESGSNRRQYLGFVGNLTAAQDGTLLLYSDDGDGTLTNWTQRSWLEGFHVGDPIVPPALPGGAVEVAPDGAWTWFNDERAIIHRGSLYAGYVRTNGQYGISRRDLATGQTWHMTISTSASAQQDDHNNPSLTVLPDGRILALYSKHIAGNQYYQRTSLVAEPASDSDWSAEIVRPTPASNTYANTYRLSGEADAIYNFHRCINFNPTLTISTDGGVTWGTARQFLGTGSGSTRPYPRYVSNNVDRIDAIYTDGHPRDVDNSVYHIYYRNGGVYRTDGTLIKSLSQIPLNHDTGERGNVIYQYSTAAWGAGQGPNDWIPSGRGWTWDVAYDKDLRPVAAFQVQRDNVTGTGWNHDRIYYYYARWTGTEWTKRFIAQAGRPLYSAEDDYGGGMALDPDDPRIVYISSNAANPFDLSSIDTVPLRANERYELWRGFTADGGNTFTWTQLTVDSALNNLRPIVPPGHGRTECLVWFYGTYTTYTNFACSVLARIGDPVVSLADWSTQNGLVSQFGPAEDADGDGSADLLEYFLGGNPTSAVSLPRISFDGTRLEFPVNRLRPGAELGVERSTNLTNWENIARIRSSGLPNETALGVTASIPATQGTASITLTPSQPIFLRLAAERVR